MIFNVQSCKVITLGSNIINKDTVNGVWLTRCLGGSTLQQLGGWRGDSSLSTGECLGLVSPPEMPFLRRRRKELPPMPAAEPCIPKPRCWLCREPSSPTALLHFQRQRSLWIPIHTSEEKPGAGSPANSQPPVLPLQPADIGPFPQHPK